MIKYDGRAGGCGGSMRAMAIGLLFSNRYDVLIPIAIESGRITHNQVNGFMGALVSALFTAFAFNDIPIYQWPSLLFSKQIWEDGVVQYLKSRTEIGNKSK